MVRGAIPRAEFVDGDNRPHTPRRPDRKPAAQTRVPSLAIYQAVDLSREPELSAWEDFHEDFSRRNARKGIVTPLGQLAIVYVDSPTLVRLLGDRYTDFSAPRKRKDLMYKFSERVREFFREQSQNSMNARVTELAQTRAMLGIGFYDPDVQRMCIDEGDMQAAFPDDTELDDNEKYELDQYTFAPGALSVRGLELYGTRGWGLDFSMDERLLGGFEDLMGYLEHEEKMQIGSVRKQWQPRSLLLRSSSLGIQPVRYAQEIPAELWFDVPKIGDPARNNVTI